MKKNIPYLFLVKLSTSINANKTVLETRRILTARNNRNIKTKPKLIPAIATVEQQTVHPEQNSTKSITNKSPVYWFEKIPSKCTHGKVSE